jgi:hypothetical protein
VKYKDAKQSCLKVFMLFANCYAVPEFLMSKKCRTGTVLGLLMISKKCGTGRVSSRTGLHDVLELLDE